ncbi:MAG: type III pantothenate kinase [Flavobacteriaceae bacterium]
MNLIIDTGNTRTKIAVFEQDKLVFLEKIDTEKIIETSKLIFKNHRIEHIIISSVGKVQKKAIQFLKKEAKTIVLNSKTKIPFNNLYKTPTTLGVDRIALMAAAVKKYPNKNALIIDAGTCITYDFITSERDYFGGAIAPGLQMKYNAMHHFTANLPALKPKITTLGNSTKNAMHQGVINGTTLEIEGIINQYKKNNDNLTVVLTGGDTFFLAKLLKSSIFANPYFLLEGLNYILNYNIKND